MMLGYPETRKGYVIKDEISGRIINCRDATFHEDMMPHLPQVAVIDLHSSYSISRDSHSAKRKYISNPRNVPEQAAEQKEIEMPHSEDPQDIDPERITSLL